MVQKIKPSDSLLILFFILFAFSLSAQNTFQVTIGGSGSDAGYGGQQTSDGGYIVTGSTSSFGGGPSDVYLVKIDAAGNLVWAKNYGGNDYDIATSVQQTSDGGYIVGGYTASYSGNWDFYALKTDASGTFVWASTFGVGGSPVEQSQCIRQTIDGGYIIVGHNDVDVYIVRLDPGGAVVWIKTYGGPATEFCFHVERTSDGNYIVSAGTNSFGAGEGLLIFKIDDAGAVLWSKVYDLDGWPFTTVQTADAGYIVTGYTSDFVQGMFDMFLMKINAGGDVTWTKTYGGLQNEEGRSVHQTTDGGYLVGGYTTSFGSGGFDVQLMKTDATGSVLWNKAYGGTGDDADGRFSQQTSDGGYVVGLWGNSFGAGSNDFYLIKTAASGSSGCNEEDIVMGSNSPTISATDIVLTVSTVGTGANVTAAESSNGTFSSLCSYLACTLTVTANTSICKGNSQVLSVAGGSNNYFWTPAAMVSPETGSIVTATPTATTTFTVTDVSCTAMATVTISVNTFVLPTLVSSANTTVCPGSITPLSVSGAVNYSCASRIQPYNVNVHIIVPYNDVSPINCLAYTLTLLNRRSANPKSAGPNESARRIRFQYINPR